MSCSFQSSSPQHLTNCAGVCYDWNLTRERAQKICFEFWSNKFLHPYCGNGICKSKYFFSSIYFLSSIESKASTSLKAQWCKGAREMKYERAIDAEPESRSEESQTPKRTETDSIHGLDGSGSRAMGGQVSHFQASEKALRIMTIWYDFETVWNVKDQQQKMIREMSINFKAIIRGKERLFINFSVMQNNFIVWWIF